MHEVSDEEFDDAVSDALQRVPSGVATHMENVALFISDDPPPEEPGILGVYNGTPLTERGGEWGFVLPDTIELFKNPLIAFSRDPEDLREQIAITIVHEIAHHVGISDEELHRLGWG